MDRRGFLKAAGASLAAPFLLSGPRIGEASVNPDRPNFLVVLLDDARYDQAQYMTKTMAALSQGMAFTNAHVPVPQCGPSRASLLTGRYAHNTGQWNNRDCAPMFRRKGRARQAYTYLLNELGGYQTAHLGKYLNFYLDVAGWVPPGHDYWLAVLLDRAPVTANVQGRIKKMRWGIGPNEGEYVWLNAESKYLAHRAKTWIADRTGPWCASVSLSSPHHPYTPTQAAKDRWAAEGVSLPKTEAWDHDDPRKPASIRRGPLTSEEKRKIEDDWTGKMQELMDADEAMADLLSAVDFESTYVFFLSDNGYMEGSHRLWKKQRAYPESTQTPLFVRGPGIEPGICDELVSSLDVFSTIAELAGIDEGLPIAPDGRSLSPLLFVPPEGADPETEDAGPPEWRETLLMEQAREPGSVYPGWEALRSRDGALYVAHESGENEFYPPEDTLQLSNAAEDPSRREEVVGFSRQLQHLRREKGDELRLLEDAI